MAHQVPTRLDVEDVFIHETEQPGLFIPQNQLDETVTTYATLISDIGTWLARDDFTDSLKGSFVRICESEIRRRVRVGAMETTDESFAVSSSSTALPSGFISMRSVSLDVTNHRNMDYLPPARLRSAPIWDISGNPAAYTIEGTNIVVAPVPTSSVNLHLVYYKMFDALSGPTDTNWLLTNAYDVYLYGSLRAACEYIQDEQQEMMFAAKFDKAVNEVNKSDMWGRVSGSALISTGGYTP